MSTEAPQTDRPDLSGFSPHPTPLSPDELRRALREAGCRFTTQRAAVYEYVASVETHPTAEEVYQTVRATCPSISLATVYNALESLVSAGLLSKLSFGASAARFDCRNDQHYHLRDEVSGVVHDLPTPFDEQLLEKLSPHLKEELAQLGFEVTGYRLEVVGRFTPESPVESKA